MGDLVRWEVSQQTPQFTTSVRPGTTHVIYRNSPQSRVDVICQRDGGMVGGLNKGESIERPIDPRNRSVGVKTAEPGDAEGFIEFHP